MFENNGDALIEIKNIVKEYRKGNNVFKACDDINLILKKGQTLGVVGESGSGKTTLARMVIGLETPTSGEILYKGEEIWKGSAEKIRENRRKIQMVFQDPIASFNPKMKVKDILLEPLLNYAKKGERIGRNNVAELLAMVELPEDFLDKYPKNMSGGQRQRVNIARALALEPEVLICDEATSALDVSIQNTIVKLLVKIQRERNLTMMFICHDLALVNSIAHTTAVMKNGKVVEVIEGNNIDKTENDYTRELLDSIFYI